MKTLIVLALATASLVACGNDDGAVATGGERSATSQEADTRLAPMSTSGDPRDLVSLLPGGTAVTLANFDTYEQLRDYSDTAVVARVESIGVATPYVEPYVMPGELEVNVIVDAVIGGRFTNISVDDHLTVILPTRATPEVYRELEPKLAALEGTARYLMFLQQRNEPDIAASQGPRFTPVLYNAPPAILAEWPHDGRLTDVAPHDHLSRGAIERGEARTGTSSPTTVAWRPTFPDQPPIGMTVAAAAATFANPTGRPQVDPPRGWDQLEPYLAPVSQS